MLVPRTLLVSVGAKNLAFFFLFFFSKGNQGDRLLFSLAFLAASLSDILISLKEMANPQWPFLFLKSSEAKIRVMQPFPKQYWSELQEKKKWGWQMDKTRAEWGMGKSWGSSDTVFPGTPFPSGNGLWHSWDLSRHYTEAFSFLWKTLILEKQCR